MKLKCLFRHKWSGWRSSPGECARINICLRCPKRNRESGWHEFSKWSDPFSETWQKTTSYGVKMYEYSKTVQTRTCSTCGLLDRNVITQ